MEKQFLKALAEKIKGKLVAIASSEKEDRMGDKLKMEDWDLKPFKKNPVLQFAHDYRNPPIGIAKNIKIEGKQLLFEPVFHGITQFSKEIEEMYMGGFMRAFSVGFMPNKDGKMELLEISCVPVPANPEALVVSKGMADIKAWELSLKELIKAISPDEKKAVEDWVKNENKDFICKEEISYIEIKPYPNEHSCRLENPDKYDKFARKNCYAKHEDKCIDFIFGIKGGKSEVQAMRYNKDTWTAEAARSHCASKDGSFEAASGKEVKKEIPQLLIIIEDEESIDKAISVLRVLKPKKEKLPVDGEVKSQRSEPKEEDDDIILHALQRTAKNINFALSKYKKKDS